MEVKVFNNLTRKKETLTPLEAGKIKFYSCGPTTYDFLHVGNARALVIGDLFHRVFKTLGYEVNFVRNFTDVDDKIIERAAELKRDALEHAAIFVRECEKDMASLGMIPATHTPKVSETMPEIIKMIEDLIKNGFGYVVNGEVLYHVPHFKTYGQLSKKDLDSLQHGIRVEVESHKKHPSDFVLWKPAKAGEVSWDSPWGKGRPGWHIECSAMAKKFLGLELDLHHGGVDLMFPHHENEIAQSEGANGKTFCQCWAHNEFLNFGSEKMSKSLGNVVTIRAFIEKYSGQVLRQILLSVHYRARMEWSDEVIERAIGDVERLHEFKLEVDQKKATQTGLPIPTEIAAFENQFKMELSQDFNSAGAFGELFSFIRFVRREILSKETSQEVLAAVQKVLTTANMALGCFVPNPAAMLSEIQKMKQSTGADASVIDKLIQERKIAKESKNWARADEIRKELTQMNVVLMDSPDGNTTWKFK
jgi:cysteinyl-tRNA synthetase